MHPLPQVTAPDSTRAPMRLRWVVPVLGIAQIISWGSLYYPIAVLGAAIRDDLGIGDIAVFGSFTVGLFVSGLAAPGGRTAGRHARRALHADGRLGDRGRSRSPCWRSRKGRRR